MFSKYIVDNFDTNNEYLQLIKKLNDKFKLILRL